MKEKNYVAILVVKIITRITRRDKEQERREETDAHI
jgi:hypothetical protein